MLFSLPHRKGYEIACEQKAGGLHDAGAKNQPRRCIIIIPTWPREYYSGFN
ncbi:MAG: hypothetical protein KME26_15430 [Oscillatoria princeps RMCB-10]|nr:hypothetical protein [Oscillatoria princeps RMCB-10]